MENKFSFLVYPDRVPFILNELGNHAEVISEHKDEEGKTMKCIQITVEWGYNLLNLFHAGIELGRQEQKLIHEKYK